MHQKLSFITKSHKIKNEIFREGDCKILFCQTAYQQIVSHLSSDVSREYGGLLLGYEWKNEIVIIKALSANYTHGTITQLVFSEDTWADFDSQVDKLIEKDSKLRRLGWYHSHPDHGIFLSNYDLDVCSSFNRQKHVALVYDPIRNEGGFFIRGCDGYNQTSPVGFVEVFESEESIVDWKNLNLSETFVSQNDRLEKESQKLTQNSIENKEDNKVLQIGFNSNKNETVKYLPEKEKPNSYLPEKEKTVSPAVSDTKFSVLFFQKSEYQIIVTGVLFVFILIGFYFYGRSQPDASDSLYDAINSNKVVFEADSHSEQTTQEIAQVVASPQPTTITTTKPTETPYSPPKTENSSIKEIKKQIPVSQPKTKVIPVNKKKPDPPMTFMEQSEQVVPTLLDNAEESNKLKEKSNKDKEKAAKKIGDVQSKIKEVEKKADGEPDNKKKEKLIKRLNKLKAEKDNLEKILQKP